jgi:hypothetical protein
MSSQACISDVRRPEALVEQLHTRKGSWATSSSSESHSLSMGYIYHYPRNSSKNKG